MPDNDYAAELERYLRSPDITGDRRVIVLGMLALHHEVKRLCDSFDPRRCACGSLDSPNHRVYCYARSTFNIPEEARDAR